MDRRVLIGGFVKIFVPLPLGSIAAAIVGRLVGTALGLGVAYLVHGRSPDHGGRCRRRCDPAFDRLCRAVGAAGGRSAREILPAVMFGSLTAILLAGRLNTLGKRHPRLTGEGRLQPGEAQRHAAWRRATGRPVRRSTYKPPHIAAAGITAISLYMAGMMCHRLFSFPAPVAMLFLAVLFKLTKGRVAPAATGFVCGLQILLDGRDLSAAVCSGRSNDAVGQAGVGIPHREHHHDRERRWPR